MVSGSRACLTFILSDHPHWPSRHFDGALRPREAYQQYTGNRCAPGRFRRSRVTVGIEVITGAIKWSDANFAFPQLRRLMGHTVWPSR